MKKIIISQFHSGKSEIETNRTSYNSDMGGYDIDTDTGKLISEQEMTEATAESPINQIELKSVFSWNNLNYALGKFSNADSRATLYVDSGATGYFSKQGNATTAITDSDVVFYKGSPHFITRGGGDTYYLCNFTGALISNQLATFNSVGGSIKPILLSNPIDNRLYVATNNEIRVWDGTTLTTGIVLPSDRIITSIATYSSYLAIGSKLQNGNSFVYIWDRDTSNVLFTQLLDFGEDKLEIVENIDGVLFGISNNSNKITIRYWTGGQVNILKRYTLGLGQTLENKKRVYDNKLYFSVRNDNALYCLYKNKTGEFTVTKRYFTLNGNGHQLVSSISFASNKLYVSSYDDTTNSYKLLYQGNNPNYSNTSYYITTENPGISTEDLARYKSFNQVYVTFKAPNTNTNLNPQIKIYASLDNGQYIQLLNENKTGDYYTGQQGIYTITTTKDINGKTLDDFIQIKFKIESILFTEILEIGYKYDTTNKANI